MVIPRAKRSLVWLSQSTSIFRNLAFEDWLFRCYDFTDCDGLLVWRNTPAVVIGRHQNVFAECNVDYLSKRNIDLVRRQSGGGTVLHSNGNFNFSFFTSNQRHNRLRNLELVCQTLKDKWNIDLKISARHDLLLNNKKPFERTEGFSYQSNATKSIKSNVGWLQQITLHFNGRQLINAIAEAFLSNYSSEMTSTETITESNLNDSSYDGISQVEDELRSWDWIFGRNPAFTLSALDRKTNKLVKINVNRGLVNSINDQDNNSLEHSYGEIMGKPFDVSFMKMFDRLDNSEPISRFAS
uniref:BPL/LPL catalytic domain-containing protein n=1 Tax=Romanomermis culicivorax TaxID=13658 RepID=A0A915L2E9_ROMCU